MGSNDLARLPGAGLHQVEHWGDRSNSSIARPGVARDLLSPRRPTVLQSPRSGSVDRYRDERGNACERSGPDPEATGPFPNPMLHQEKDRWGGSI